LKLSCLEYRERLGIKKAEIVVCIVAALRPEKKHVLLLDAVNILNQRGIPVRILIVGDGPERNNIEKHMKQIGIKPNVIITGFQSDVRPYISLSDIIVMSSNSETFSIAILEAMALGKPIIAPDIGGIAEQVIHGENGFLFLSGDVEGLANNIEMLISQNLFESMGEASRRMVCEKFTIDQLFLQ
jgi:glycosyltransferase involved in cell wall biosynthesis